MADIQELEKRKEGQSFAVTLATISEIMNGNVSSSEKSCLFVGLLQIDLLLLRL